MFSFFKKRQKEEPKKENNLLEIESSVFHTEAPATPNTLSTDNVDEYKSLVYQPPVYDVAPYKATRKERTPVVVDKEQLGYQEGDYHENISTVELVKDEQLSETIIMEDLDKEKEESYFSAIEPINEPIKEIASEKIDFIHVPSVDITSASDENKDALEQFALFGSVNAPLNKKEQQSKEEEPLKLIQEVKYTEDGYKICPQCGAILNPDAPVCFMCSKSFVLKK